MSREQRLDSVETINDLKKIAAKPLAFTIKMANDMAKEALKPMIVEAGMPWEPVEKLLDEVDTLQELRDIVANPSDFVEKAKATGVEAAMEKAKEMLRPLVEETG